MPPLSFPRFSGSGSGSKSCRLIVNCPSIDHQLTICGGGIIGFDFGQSSWPQSHEMGW